VFDVLSDVIMLITTTIIIIIIITYFFAGASEFRGTEAGIKGTP